MPIYQESANKLKGLESEGLSIQSLQNLNATDKLPKGLGRINVNFQTGELRLPFIASPEAQQFVKTVNDFTTKAKDTFGARITNFELNRFLRRLPTLMNSTEGRKSILRQMEIVNRLNTLNEQAILDTFEKVGGIRNIDYDEAERRARKEIAKESNDLKKEYVSLESDVKDFEKNNIRMRDPAGNIRLVPKDQVKAAQDVGYRKVS